MKQFIVFQELSVADRLGKFTMVQWAFLAGGVAIAMFVLIMGFMPIIPTVMLGIVFVSIGAFLAFYQKYGMPIYEFIFVYLTFQTQPKKMAYGSNDSDDDFDEFEEDIELLMDDFFV